MPNFSIQKKIIEARKTYRLIDRRRKMEFGIVPDIGNWGYTFRVNDKPVLLAPDSFESYIAKQMLGNGNPLMAPFANRIDRDHYFFQGKKYLLNGDLGNFLRTPPKDYPIHGLLVYDKRWRVTKTSASDSAGASLTSCLEFYKYPDLMAQFPFAHICEITYRLKGGMLQCTTKIMNIGLSDMPVHLGYHPYFVPDGPREAWALHIAARAHWIVTPALIPTGETEPAEKYLPGCRGSLALGDTYVDAGFTDLERDKDGLAHFWVAGATQKIEVIMDRHFSTAIIFAPLDRQFFCIEPQTGPTNAFNLEHEGKFDGLTMPPTGLIPKDTDLCGQISK
jgi:aldose 1-epimerase